MSKFIWGKCMQIAWHRAASHSLLRLSVARGATPAATNDGLIAGLGSYVPLNNNSILRHLGEGSFSLSLELDTAIVMGSVAE